MKLYLGVQTGRDRRVVVTSSTAEFDDYRLSTESSDYTEDFEWGTDRAGSASALAVALLADHQAGSECDPKLCRRFAETLVAELPANFWVLSEREVAAALARLAAEPA